MIFYPRLMYAEHSLVCDLTRKLQPGPQQLVDGNIPYCTPEPIALELAIGRCCWISSALCRSESASSPRQEVASQPARAIANSINILLASYKYSWQKSGSSRMEI